MQITADEARVLLIILEVYIPVAAPYTDEDVIESARKIKEKLEQEIDDE